MSEVKVIRIEQDIFAANEDRAQETREKLKKNGTFFVNVMSGPGSGKTTTLSAVINRMKKDYRIGEMDVDIETSMDAQRVADLTGVQSLQIHNGGLCHIDADMTARALEEYDIEGLDLLILENIGNLVCPAEFDTGAHKSMMILSVPEGDDKPLKYPLMFSISDVVMINKIDTMGFFNFDLEAAKERILKLNPDAKIFPISAKTGEGLDAVTEWLAAEIAAVKGACGEQ
jgi:hydrogenase nickel incorporation protein HypB